MSLFLLIGKLFRQPTFKAIALHCFVSVPNYQRFWIEKILKKLIFWGQTSSAPLPARVFALRAGLTKIMFLIILVAPLFMAKEKRGKDWGEGSFFLSFFSLQPLSSLYMFSVRPREKQVAKKPYREHLYIIIIIIIIVIITITIIITIYHQTPTNFVSTFFNNNNNNKYFIHP